MYALLKMTQNIKQAKPPKIFLLTFQDKNLQNLVLELNKEGQLRVGLQANGLSLPSYSFATQIISGGQKRAGTPYTLFDTGEFYRSFDLLVTGAFLQINADTQKPDKDLQEYGELLGLTEQSRAVLIEDVIPVMRATLLSEWLDGTT